MRSPSCRVWPGCSAPSSSTEAMTTPETLAPVSGTREPHYQAHSRPRRSNSAADPLPVRVAEFALVELAVGVSGQLVHIVHAARQLEPSEPTLGERQQLL